MKKVGIYSKGKTSIEAILHAIHKNPSIRKAGAIACFVGIVRGISSDGRKVWGLSFESYRKKAVESLQKIRDEMISRDGIIDVFIHHNIGLLEVGEEIVYVVVVGRSRKEVFPTLIETVEKVKKGAPIFKKEILSDGSSYWVSEKHH
jgi:molybdopterin synthase catalytic subunit